MIALLLTACMLLPCAAFADENAEVTVPMYGSTRIFEEKHLKSTIDDYKTGNDLDTSHVYTNATAGVTSATPLNNLYDLQIVGDEHPTLDMSITSKNLKLQGNHASETKSKNLVLLTPAENGGAGKGMMTVVPQSLMENADAFTISYIERQYTPADGALGLVLFYDNAATVNGIDYFNGYNNYTFTGFTGANMGTYAAYSIYDGVQTDFTCAAMTTKPTKNASVYVSVTCTKGTYTVDGKTYTAKIESYVDDYLISVSYAQWKDAPIMVYYESEDSKNKDNYNWQMQFTNITVDALKESPVPVQDALDANPPLAITGTAVRYSGGSGLRFYMDMEKEVVYEAAMGGLVDYTADATAVETGVIMLEQKSYTGELTVDTEGILKSNAPRVQEQSMGTVTCSYAFTDSAALDGKSFIARGYVKYTIEGQSFYYYTAVEKASCKRTAAKVALTVTESRKNADMLAACKELAGTIEQIPVMTFNVMVHDEYEIGGVTVTAAQRAEAAINMMLTQQPAVIGLQEVSDTILQCYLANSELMEIYDYVGSAAHAESGEEGLYIFYKKDMFELQSSGVKWLSDTPDTEHSMFAAATDANANKGASFYPRKVVWSVLKSKASGVEFAFCNTHLAYSGQLDDSTMAESIRLAQAKKLMELIVSDAMFDHNLFYIIAGDMNAKLNSDPYLALMDGMEDMRFSSSIAPDPTYGTHHGYVNKITGSSVIDHIFISENDFCAVEETIINSKYDSTSLGSKIYPSDHFPLYGVLVCLPD